MCKVTILSIVAIVILSTVGGTGLVLYTNSHQKEPVTETQPVSLVQPKPSAPAPLTVPSEPKPVRLSKSEIAERVEKQIRETRFLEVTSLVSQERTDGSEIVKPIIVKSVMAKNAVKTTICDDQKMVRGISVVDDVVQEFSTVRGVIDEYPAEFPHGIGGAKYALQTDCLLGNQMFSWVMVPKENTLPRAMDNARSMRERIEKGIQETDREERSMDCYVFRQMLSPCTPGQIDLLTFVDKKSLWIVRWDKIDYESSHVTKRQFDITAHASVPTDIDWKLHVQNKDNQTVTNSKKP